MPTPFSSALGTPNRRVRAAGLVACLVATVGCGGDVAAPIAEEERFEPALQTTASFDGLTFPNIRVTVSVATQSSTGQRLYLTSVTIDGVLATMPAVVAEGIHDICVTVASTSGRVARECVQRQLFWPK